VPDPEPDGILGVLDGILKEIQSINKKLPGDSQTVRKIYNYLDASE